MIPQLEATTEPYLEKPERNNINVKSASDGKLTAKPAKGENLELFFLNSSMKSLSPFKIDHIEDNLYDWAPQRSLQSTSSQQDWHSDSLEERLNNSGLPTVD